MMPSSFKQKLSIKNWAIEDRPREKLMAKGISTLSDAELLAILIGSGTKNQTAVELSQEILQKSSNNLNELGKKTVYELTKSKGIGEAKAITIVAAMELGRRRKNESIKEKSKITGSIDVFNYFQPLVGDLTTEQFWTLMLNRSNKIIDKFKASQGGLTGTVVDTREILREALEKRAVGIILCHNHPSGNLKPSTEDISTTKKLKAAATTMDIALLDHLIVTDAGYYSFADEGIL